MQIPAKSPIETLIFLTASLIDIMMREIDLLKNMQPQQIRDLQDEKAELARAYETCMTRLKAEPQMLSGATKALKQQLKDLTARFQVVLAENERALIVNAVAEKQNGSAYSASGALGTAAMATNRPMAMRVNERL
jgi:hypothetical protein